MTEKQAQTQTRSRAHAPSHTWAWLAPVGLLVALALPGFAGGRWAVDTGWYAGIALQVFREGDWWTLGAGDANYFNKPPLGFWFHGLFLWILGGELWVIRASMLLAAAACVGVTAMIGRQLAGPNAGPRTGFWSGLVLALTIEFARHTDRFRLDYLHLLFILLGMLAIVHTAKTDRPRTLLWSGLFIGLALMTKPIAALLLFPLAAIWLIWIGRRPLVRWLIPPAALALAIATPWHLAMTLEHGHAFTHTYFTSQSLERALGIDFSPEPWHWYLKHLAQTYWPWNLAIVLTLALILRHRKTLENQPILKLAIVMGGGGLLALALFADKREHYAFMVYPALAWFCSVGLAAATPDRLNAFIHKRWLTLTTTALAGAVAYTLVIAPRVAPTPTLPWHNLYTFISTHQQAGETEFWNGQLSYQDAGMIYTKTGVWPRWIRTPDGSTRTPPPGALVIYADAGETRPPNTAINTGFWWERIIVIQWPSELPQGWSIGDPAGDRPVHGQSPTDFSPP